MSIAELEELADDPLALDSFINNMDSVKECIALRDQLLQTTTEQARKNLSRESEVKTLSDENAGLRTQLQDQHNILQAAQQKQLAITQKYSAKNIVGLLTASVEQAEIECDKLKKRFEDGDDEDVEMKDEDGSKSKPKKKLTIPQFVKEYSKLRETVHSRSAKKERLLEVYGRS